MPLQVGDGKQTAMHGFIPRAYPKQKHCNEGLGLTQACRPDLGCLNPWPSFNQLGIGRCSPETAQQVPD